MSHLVQFSFVLIVCQLAFRCKDHSAFLPRVSPLLTDGTIVNIPSKSRQFHDRHHQCPRDLDHIHIILIEKLSTEVPSTLR